METRGIVRRIESCQIFRAKVSLIGLHRISIMKKWRRPFITVVLLALFAAFNRSSGADPDLTAEQPFMSRAEVRQQGAVTVRAAVLTDDESERYFGAWLTMVSRSFG